LNSIGLGGDRVVADVNLAAVIEIAASRGRRLGILRQASGGEGKKKKNGDDKASAEHGRPLWGKSVAPNAFQGKRH
jgi:hypothetical protein